MHRVRKSAVAVAEALVPAEAKADRSRMNAEEFAFVASRITRTVTVDRSVRLARTAGVMASAAAEAFNAQAAEARRTLLLAQGQLSVFGAVREAVASDLRRRARERDEAHAVLIAEHAPLLK